MVASNTALYASGKSQRRMNHAGEAEPIAVQIAGAEPAMMADAARLNVDRGAQIIDINMGCPAKKVCNKWAGSALLQDEPLVAKILDAVIGAVDVPVTLKIRTGWDPEHRNAVRIAKLAQAAGIQMLTMHGRTRACGYKGAAEYDTIREVRQHLDIPLTANGDITSPEKARQVLAITGADALMIGRAAQGRPWIFREIEHFLATGEHLPAPRVGEAREIMLEHLRDHYEFYGDYLGVRTARKHIIWYTKGLAGSAAFRSHMNTLDSIEEQLAAVSGFFSQQEAVRDRLEYEVAATMAANDEPQIREALAA
jgi:tRNA-dihydrouridine synthase B